MNEDPLNELLVEGEGLGNGLFDQTSNTVISYNREVMQQSVNDLYEGLSQSNRNSESLVVGGPKDGEIISSKDPYLTCVIHEPFEVDGKANVTVKRYQEKTLVIDSQGKKKWVGWDNNDERDYTELSVKKFKYKRIVLNKRNTSGLMKCILFVPSYVDIENTEISAKEIIERVDTKLSYDDIEERFISSNFPRRLTISGTNGDCMYFDNISSEYPLTPNQAIEENRSLQVTADEIDEAAEYFRNLNQ